MGIAIAQGCFVSETVKPLDFRDSFARATVRVALRQLKASDRPLPALAAWLSAHDRFDPAEVEDERTSIRARPDPLRHGALCDHRAPS
jgi:transposase